MTKQVRLRRGTTAQVDAYLGPIGELIIDTDRQEVRLQNGAAGGVRLPRFGGEASFSTLTASGTVTLTGGTANGVAYLNGSRVLTTGAELSFDGTNLSLLPPGVSIFGASGAEQMRLTSTGLGIGTSTPVFKLDVVGVSRSTSNGSTGAVNATHISSNAIDAPDNGSKYSFSLAGTAFESAFVSQVREGSSPGVSLVFGTSANIATTNASSKLILNSAGNLGLGVPPSAWVSNAKAIDIGLYTSIADTANGLFSVGYNSYESPAGTFRYKLTGVSAQTYLMSNGGGHVWFTAPSGTAGAPITFTQAMTLTQGGNLLVGTTGDSGNRLRIVASSADADVVRWENQAGTLTAALGVSTANGYLYSTTTSNHAYVLGTNNAERARITSAGDFIKTVNTTAPTLTVNNTMTTSLPNNTTLRFHVRGSDGVTRTADLTLV